MQLALEFLKGHSVDVHTRFLLEERCNLLIGLPGIFDVKAGPSRSHGGKN